MPTDYVEDYEEVTGKKLAATVKVVTAPEQATPAPAAVAETK